MKVFISYSHRDKSIARSIAERLVEEGFTPIFDEDIVKPGQSWTEGIHRALASSDVLIVLISRSTVKSNWQSSEIALATAQQFSAPAKRVIPVLIEEGAELPFFLRDKLYCDMSSSDRIQANFPQLVSALSAEAELDAGLNEVSKARLRELKIQQEILKTESQKLERKWTMLNATVLGSVVSIAGVAVAAISYFAGKSTLNLGLFEDVGPLALGALFGVLASVMAPMVGKYFQKKSSQKEVDHGHK